MCRGTHRITSSDHCITGGIDSITRVVDSVARGHDLFTGAIVWTAAMNPSITREHVGMTEGDRLMTGDDPLDCVGHDRCARRQTNCATRVSRALAVFRYSQTGGQRSACAHWLNTR